MTIGTINIRGRNECYVKKEDYDELKEKADRMRELLVVCMDFITKQIDSPYTLSIVETLHEYDETECDGFCLLDDINSAI